MKLTILLDLDDTLLDSDMDKFIPVYFHKLSEAMAEYIAPEKLLKFLMQGTNAMIGNDNPTKTLEEVFSREFYPNLGVAREILDPLIVDFYENAFPGLAPLTKARPEAVELVEWAFAQGYKIAISTNPLFPKAAIYHRLRWAGLAPEQYPFDIISTFETFHFSKPNPAYLAEVLGRIGWDEGAVLVVGDDPLRDMEAAQNLGLPAYWVADDEAVLPEGVNSPLGRGSIGALRGWIEAQDAQAFTPSYQAKNAVVATVKAIPAVLAEVLSDLPAGAWTESSHPDEWSLVEVISHLRDVEREVNYPRIQAFLREDDPFITADDTDMWVAERGYAEQNGAEALQDFIAARMNTLDALKNLSDKDWQRTGKHAIFGPVTLLEQIAFMAEHDRVHLRQVHKVLKKQ